MTHNERGAQQHRTLATLATARGDRWAAAAHTRTAERYAAR